MTGELHLEAASMTAFAVEELFHDDEANFAF